MSEAKVTKARYAGRNKRGQEHQVLRVEGGPGQAYRRQPCATCPWRVDAVGEFPAEAFRISAHTAYDAAMETFACHTNGVQKPAICAGFLLRNADHNLMVRFKLMQGSIDMAQVGNGGVQLHGSYRAMAEANGVAPDDPVLAPCRANHDD